MWLASSCSPEAGAEAISQYSRSHIARLNKVIELLEQGKVVFDGAVVAPGNVESATAFADLGYDFIIFEMEHEGFDFSNLRLSLQFLLNRKRMAAKATLQPDVMG
jgi:hypothetical protein